MFSLAHDWNPGQAALKNVIKKPGGMADAIALILRLHGMVHFSGLGAGPTYADEIVEGEPVFDNVWRKKMQATVTDTGNVMTNEEILDFSRRLDKVALREYRNSVGLRPRQIVQNLGPDDMKRSVPKSALKRVQTEGGVVNHPESVCLLDFWSRKDGAGLMLMPVTRHQIVHWNDCARLKKRISRHIVKTADRNLR